MSAGTKAVVVTVVAIVCVYFLAGLVGVLPSQYDIIKRAVGIDDSTNTTVQIDIQDWNTRFDFGVNEGRVVDSITYKGYCFFVTLGEGQPYILQNDISAYRLDDGGTWNTIPKSKIGDNIDISTQFTFAHFVEYKNSNLDDALYLVTSGYTSYYGGTDITRYRATYDGITWYEYKYIGGTTWDGDDKLIPMMFEETTTIEKLTSPLRLEYCTLRISEPNNMYAWSGHWVSGNWQIDNTLGIAGNYDGLSIAQYKFNPTSAYVTFISVSNGVNAFIYYNPSGGLTPFTLLGDYPPYDETRINKLFVYDDKLYMGTSKGRIWIFDAYTGNITLEYSSTSEGIKSFGVYNNKLYAGGDWELGWKLGEGKIFVDDGTGFKRDGTIEAHTIYSFVSFTENSISKFFATSGDEGIIYQYSETLIYTNPQIEHTPVTEGYLNQPTVIRCTVKDADGIPDREVKIYYKVYGQITRFKNMTRISGDSYDGQYETTIPEQSNLTRIDYYIKATDSDGNYTTTSSYTINIVETPTLFGLDYRIWYIVAIIITLILGAIAYPREKKSSWRRVG